MSASCVHAHIVWAQRAQRGAFSSRQRSPVGGATIELRRHPIRTRDVCVDSRRFEPASDPGRRTRDACRAKRLLCIRGERVRTRRALRQAQPPSARRSTSALAHRLPEARRPADRNLVLPRHRSPRARLGENASRHARGENGAATLRGQRLPMRHASHLLRSSTGLPGLPEAVSRANAGPSYYGASARNEPSHRALGPLSAGQQNRAQ